ncbi:hypothetical protein T440DRAFT_455929 [Plenodomus tracheiphilus IPT5]|uniref:TPR-like protein n=1 Tax=Plenodomus tracheiphilus IPT5 TaxID=1408161 RepID=A0A6A7AZG8_9PLEO|nr:hypothetical protein T440DRAFT_455929 [Plenodomus tracheiphilus IPT5]
MRNSRNAKGDTSYYDLGEYTRVAHTLSPAAQTWFNRGLVWCYSFNHEAAIQCFQQAAKYDKECGAAYWGIAYAIGPNYNKSWRLFTRDERKSSIAKALGAMEMAKKNVAEYHSVEKALLMALVTRFPTDIDNIPEDLSSYDYAYAKAMESVYAEYRDDVDVAALFADAIMCTRPRRLWNLNTGEPTGQDVVEARKALERGLASSDGRNHPGLCHLYIHMMELTQFPELALPAADRLRSLVPDGSHMQHMATHIDVACGDYRRAIDSGLDAIRSDDAYFGNETVKSIIYNAYRSHNVHALAYSAMMSGRREEAIYAAGKLGEILTEEYMSIKTPRMVDWTEWQYVTLPHVLIRFGQWEDILKLQLPTNQSLLCVYAATILYARGIALAVLGKIEEARVTREDFEKARLAIPQDRMYGPSSPAAPILDVAAAMLEGELEYRAGNYTGAFAALRRGIELEDDLLYSDPPLWMQPVRHALGALLLEQGHSEEAELVYMEDLGLSDTHPRRKARINNVWGLHGLHECLLVNDKLIEAKRIRLQRDIAMASADITIGASCFCRLKKAKECAVESQVQH